MKRNHRILPWLALLALAFVNLQPSTLLAQGTAFTYQGQLTVSGGPANGSFDLTFALFESNSGGSAVAGPITNAGMAVTSGLFTVALDFGPGVFTGGNYWLEVGVRTNGGSSFTTLSPRQLITPSPYAIYAPNAGAAQTAGSASAVAPEGTVPLTALPSAVLTNGAGGVNLSGAFAGNGSGLTNVPASWQTVSGASQTAVGNQAYLLTNNALDTLVLPSAPSVGDVVTVSGVGTNGWQVAPAAGQAIVGVNAVPGVSWSEQSGALSSAQWYAVASSADGSRLAAVAWQGGVYTSTNYGVNWALQSGAPTSAAWQNIVSSADGSHLAASVSSGSLYTSTNFGTNWTQQNNAPASPSAIAMSSDGTRLAAAVWQGGIYTSANAGSAWTTTAAPSPNNWHAISSSADGTRLVAAVSYGGIYTSANSGSTWTPQMGTPSAGGWWSLASSSDGSHVVAVAMNGGVYTSCNFGTNWNLQTGAPSSAAWVALASSADGRFLLAAVDGDGLYTSTNFGTNWIEQLSVPAFGQWNGVASSANGDNLAAVSWGGGIYTSASSPGPYGGVAGVTAQFQYIGGGLWQPLVASAGIATGPVSLAQLPPAVLTNGETGVTLGGVFSGDGSGLTSLPSAVVTNNESGVTLGGVFSGGFNGTISGNGAGLTNLPTGGGGGSSGWSLTGNAGTIPGTDFVGTTDDEALVLKVNGQQSLYLDTTGDLVGGRSNFVGILASAGTIGGGSGNTINIPYATVGGGFTNIASGYGATVGGGVGNTASNGYATVVGGGANTASGQFATVGGGVLNIASGNYSFAAGTSADATNSGAFVWADGSGGTFSSTSNNQFNVRASGGARFVTGGAGMTLDGAPVLTASSGSLGIVLQQNAAGAPNVIAGSPVNYVPNGVVGATISGGGATNFLGYPSTNGVTADFGTVGGGQGSTATGIWATVSGGQGNTASGNWATVNGGQSNLTSGSSATVGGGAHNAAGYYGTVGGGLYGNASGPGAFVGGGRF